MSENSDKVDAMVIKLTAAKAKHVKDVARYKVALSALDEATDRMSKSRSLIDAIRTECYNLFDVIAEEAEEKA